MKAFILVMFVAPVQPMATITYPNQQECSLAAFDFINGAAKLGVAAPVAFCIVAPTK